MSTKPTEKQSPCVSTENSSNLPQSPVAAECEKTEKIESSNEIQSSVEDVRQSDLEKTVSKHKFLISRFPK